MAKRIVRLAWITMGICLVIGMVLGVLILIGPPDQPWHQALRELSTLLDVAALLIWIAIFALYWQRRQPRG